MLRKILSFSMVFAFVCISQAQPIKVLFVGNSFTYEPQEMTNPSLPQEFYRIASSLGHDVVVSSIVKGGQTIKRHVDDGEVLQKISSEKFDFVVVQAQSIEALVLPKCFSDNGGPIGRPEFLQYSATLLKMIEDHGATPIVMAHWSYQKDHPWLMPDFPCLKFAPTEGKAGQNWFGQNLSEMQNLLNEGFGLAAKTSARAQVSAVGDAWQKVLMAQNSLVKDMDLYQDDSYHPTKMGSFLAAVVLAKDILKVDPQDLKYHPPEVSVEHFEFLKASLKK